MNIDLSSLRKNYKKNLLEYNNQKNPFKLFHNWFQQEKLIHRNENLDQEINAMSLSTIGMDGSPDTRVVLLKEYSNKGFIFYTNYLSSKGISIKNFPKVCLSFFWEKTERQVIIKGITYKLKKEKSDEYFDKRPIENKIGCWSSRQSFPIPSRKYLINKYKKWNKYFTKKKLTRPFYWGGYIVNPYQMEFWEGKPNRLHDRIVYNLTENEEWITKILSP